jgi:sigma-B regulation protein RsbU (phosphoserine phosphatase)
VRRFALLLCLILASSFAAQAQQSEILPLPWISWQFHSGDDPRCATIDGIGCTVHPGVDPANEQTPSSADEWQRITVTLPAQFHAQQQLGLLMEDESPPYRVFINGKFIGSLGDLRSHTGPYNSRIVFPFSSSLAPGGQLVIAIHAFSFSGEDNHALAPAIGALTATQSLKAENTLRYLRANWQHFLCFFVVFCSGLFFLLLFLLDWQSSEYLWLGVIFCTIGYLRFIELAGVVNVGISLALANIPYYFGEALLCIATVNFCFAFLRRRVWLACRLLQITSLSMLWFVVPFLPVSFATLSGLSRVMALEGELFVLILTITSFVFLLPLPLCFRSPLPEMRWIGGAFLFLFFEDVNRWISNAASYGLPRIPTIPQEIVLGDFILDLRGLAYMLLAIVMIVAMTVRFRRVQSRNLQVESDLEAARTVQQLLIPSESPDTPGFVIESVYLPAQEVGGDFFHVAPASDGSLVVVVGDVSGKGLSAAMTVSAIIGALRADPAREPAEVLTHLNQALYGHISGFATCCVAHFGSGGQLTLANAGHLSPYRNGTELSLANALPLGLTQDADYRSESFSLQAGDHLTFVSDGIVETLNRGGELFGFDRTAVVSTQSARFIAEKAQSFGVGMPQADDITVLTLDCSG